MHPKVEIFTIESEVMFGSMNVFLLIIVDRCQANKMNARSHKYDVSSINDSHLCVEDNFICIHPIK